MMTIDGKTMPNGRRWLAGFQRTSRSLGLAAATESASRALTAGSLPGFDQRSLWVLGALVLFLWSGVFSLYPTTGWVDPGLYIYWMLNPSENATVRGVDYHSARLGFILPGALAYRVFGMVTAHAVLATAFYVLGLAAVMLIAAGALRSLPARSLVLVTIGSNVLWTSAFTRGYTDGAAMAYGLLALAILLNTRAPPGPRRHALAGCLLILAFCSHPIGGAIAGLTAIFVGLTRATSVGAALVNGTAAVFGAGACLLLLGGFASWLGMPFLFLKSLLPTVDLALAGAYELFFVSSREWMPQAPRILLVPITAVLLLAGLKGLWPIQRQVAALFVAAIVPLVALGVWSLRSTSMVQTSFYASYFLFSLVPALILFLRRIEDLGELPDRWRMAGLLAVLLLATAVGAWLPFGLRAERGFALGTWFVVGAGFLIGLGMVLWRRSKASVAALTITIALAGSLNGDTGRGFQLAGAANHAASQAVMGEMHRFLTEQGALQGRYHLWMNRDRFTQARQLPPGDVYRLAYGSIDYRMNLLDTLAASLGWHLAAIGFQMPRMDAAIDGLANLEQITHEPSTFIALCGEPGECEQGLAALGEMGVRIAAPSMRSIEIPNAPRVTILIATIAALNAPDEVSGAQLSDVLARVLRADAWAAGTGGAFPDVSSRASWHDPHWPPAPTAQAELQDFKCVAGDRTRHCWLRYAMAGHDAQTRHLRFVRHGPLWRLTRASAPTEASARDFLSAGLPALARAGYEAGSGADRLIAWHGPDRTLPDQSIPLRDLYDIATAFARQALVASNPPPATHPRIDSLGETMPRAYRSFTAWQFLTRLNNESFRLMVLCSLPRECDDGLLAMRELGFQVVPHARNQIESPGLPPLTVASARIFVPPPVDEPGLPQLNAVLERALRLDAWEAQSGQRIAAPAERALAGEPDWPDQEGETPPIQRAACTASPNVRDCRVWYALADGRVVDRLFGFQRHGNLWWNSYDIPPPR